MRLAYLSNHTQTFEKIMYWFCKSKVEEIFGVTDVLTFYVYTSNIFWWIVDYLPVKKHDDKIIFKMLWKNLYKILNRLNKNSWLNSIKVMREAYVVYHTQMQIEMWYYNIKVVDMFKLHTIIWTCCNMYS